MGTMIKKEHPLAQRTMTGSEYAMLPEIKARRHKLIAALNAATLVQRRAEADLIDRLKTRQQQTKPSR